MLLYALLYARTKKQSSHQPSEFDVSLSDKARNELTKPKAGLTSKKKDL